MSSLITRTVRPVRTQLQDRFGAWPQLSWPVAFAPATLWAQLDEHLAVAERLGRLAGSDLRNASSSTVAGRELTVALAGFTPADVHVEIVGRALHVRAEAEGRIVTWSATLPGDVDRDKIEVSMADGMLRVQLPAVQPYRRALRLAPGESGTEIVHEDSTCEESVNTDIADTDIANTDIADSGIADSAAEDQVAS